MTGWLISHPTVLSSSRLIPPHVETVLTHSKCVLLPKVAGGGLVVVGGELLECGDVPLLIPVNCGGMSLSALVNVEGDRLPADSSS